MTDSPQIKKASCGIIVMLAAAQFTMVLDTTVMNVSFAQVARDLYSTVVSLQAAITLYTLVMAAVLLLGGNLGDRRGAKLAFTVGLQVFGAGSLTTPPLRHSRGCSSDGQSPRDLGRSWSFRRSPPSPPPPTSANICYSPTDTRR